jgi:molybdopterin-binding protein
VDLSQQGQERPNSRRTPPHSGSGSRSPLAGIPRITSSGSLEKRRRTFRRVSGRNQLIGWVTDIKISGLLAQVTLSIGEQHITSIITADAVRELRLKKGQIAAALIKSTEVMIVLPD